MLDWLVSWLRGGRRREEGPGVTPARPARWRSWREPPPHDFTVREPPPRVVGELREIDPRADLVYIGEGEWLLGRRWPFNRLRDADIRNRLAWELQLPVSARRDKRIALNRLYLSGFRPIFPTDEDLLGTLGYQTEEFGRIREDLRWKVHTETNDRDRVFESHLDEITIDDEAGQRAAREYMEAEGRSDHRILFRHRRSIINAVRQ